MGGCRRRQARPTRPVSCWSDCAHAGAQTRARCARTLMHAPGSSRQTGWLTVTRERGRSTADPAAARPGGGARRAATALHQECSGASTKHWGRRQRAAAADRADTDRCRYRICICICICICTGHGSLLPLPREWCEGKRDASDSRHSLRSTCVVLFRLTLKSFFLMPSRAKASSTG